MKAVLLAAWICLSTLPAFAQNQNGQGQNNNNQGGGVHGAPAPLIGAGIPALIVVGGVLLGRKLLRRKRK
jgi:hypothetical protein